MLSQGACVNSRAVIAVFAKAQRRKDLFQEADRLVQPALRPWPLDELGDERLERESIHPQFRRRSALQRYHDFEDPGLHFFNRFEACDEPAHASLIHFSAHTYGGDGAHLKDVAATFM
jgi:hypothetical protein